MSSIRNAYSKYGIAGAIVAGIIVSPLDDIALIWIGKMALTWLGGH